MMQMTGESDLQRIIQHAPIGICILDATTLVAEMVNDTFLEVSGKPYEAIYGQFYWDAFKETKPYYEAALRNVVLTGVPYYANEVEMMLIRHENEEKMVVTFVYYPIKNAAGKVTKVSIWVLEKTLQVRSRQQIQQLNEELVATNNDLKQTEENLISSHTQLAVSEAKFRSLVMDSPIAQQVFRGEDLVLELVNETMLQFLGRKADIIGKTLFEGIPEIVGQPIVDLLKQVYRTGEPLDIKEEPVTLRRNGKEVLGYYNVSYRPLYDNKQITGVLGIAIDVTGEVMARQTITESEERFRTMAESSGVYIAVGDETSNATYFNNMWTNTTGRPMKSLLRFGWVDSVHPDDRERYLHIYLDAYKIKGLFTGEFRLLNKEGNYNWLLANGTPRFNTDGSFAGYISSAIDISDRKKAEEILAKNIATVQKVNEEMAAVNEELKATNDELQQVQDNLLAANSQLEESEDLKNKAIEQAQLGIWYIEAETRAFRPSARLKELFGYLPDETMPYDAAVDQIREDYRDTVLAAVDEAIQTGKEYNLEYPIIGYRDQQLRWVRATGKINPVRNGGKFYFSGTIMDITEQKQDDQRKNDFISMVSHELKTPLTSIMGYTQLLEVRAKKAGDDFSANILNKTNKQVGKMTTMINGFLNVSRLESGKIHIEKQVFDMATLVAETEEETLSTLVNHNIIYAPVEHTLVNADQDKIGHVINNLISNAVKYSPAGSNIYVACVTIDGNAQVSVKDEGIGITPEDQGKLFERYYRVNNHTASTIAGFGIGLYICAEIMQRHEGKIWVESERGKGSTFYFSLPLYTAVMD